MDTFYERVFFILFVYFYFVSFCYFPVKFQFASCIFQVNDSFRFGVGGGGVEM